MDQSPRVENGFTVSGMSARLGFVLLICAIAASSSLTGSEFHFVAPIPRTIRVHPGASAMSLISLAMRRLGMYPLTRMGVLGVKGGKLRFFWGSFWYLGITVRRGIHCYKN